MACCAGLAVGWPLAAQRRAREGRADAVDEAAGVRMLVD